MKPTTKLLLFLLFFIPVVLSSGCAEFSQTMKDNSLLMRLGIKDTTIVAIGKSGKTDEARKKSADFVDNAANQTIAFLEGSSGNLTKDVIVAKFREYLGGNDMPLYYKIVIDDLVIILDEMYKPGLPKVEIPEQYKGDIVKVLGYVKEGAAFFR